MILIETLYYKSDNNIELKNIMQYLLFLWHILESLEHLWIRGQHHEQIPYFARQHFRLRLKTVHLLCENVAIISTH